MKINNNVVALNTYHQLNKNNFNTAKKLEKLSSGLRINRAADDAAGLAISEKMKSQIRGLKQADRNILDGISLIQTAEGGLNSIQDKLQRIRELAIQAGNDTLTDFDKQQIQLEIDQLKKGIDETAYNTEFNGILPLIEAQRIGEGSSGGTGKADIIFIIDRTGSMGGPINNVINNLQAFTQSLANHNIQARYGLVTYSDINYIEEEPPLIKYDFTDNVELFQQQINNINLSWGGDLPESGLEAIMDPTYGAMSFDFSEGASKQFILITDAINHDLEGTGRSIYSTSQVAETLQFSGVHTTIISDTDPSSDEFAQLSQLSSPISATDSTNRYFDIRSNFSENLEQLADYIRADSSSSELLDLPFVVIQTGANKGNHLEIPLADVRLEALGLEHLTIEANVDEAIELIDQALQRISSERAKFGAYHNRLEHIHSNVANYTENITAANSRIRDADMALEMTEFTKRNILNQSATAMLAQANQLPQGILQLLQ
ncbi:flagellin [Alkalihalobacillus sp. MEB130]|uniref:flagellin N-terminal helical domain-containing protein n=1 Tax=Alkalihalobacillus sp. MEB130 TaxID=2976704 RepID=UPI0028DF5857|nr:flagellin [Alkalihalobacillus sp. MEB130]MDT8858934.1 flagellin [Alkalihalobacillus sp. MEB130]